MSLEMVVFIRMPSTWQVGAKHLEYLPNAPKMSPILMVDTSHQRGGKSMKAMKPMTAADKEKRKRHMQEKKQWEALRRKKVSAEGRKNALEALVPMVDGNVRRMAGKHDGSRILQSLILHGDVKVRAQIVEELKDHIVELSSSPYAKHLLCKLLLRTSAAGRADMLAEIKEGFMTMLRPECSLVLDAAWACASSTTQSEMIHQFPADKQFAISKKLLERGMDGSPVIHRMLWENRGGDVGFCREWIGSMLKSRYGVLVAIRCLVTSTAKERKSILRAIKEEVVRHMTDPYGHLFLCAVFDVVDDTKMVDQTLLPSIRSELQALAKDKYGRRPLLYLLSGEMHSKFFGRATVDEYKLAINAPSTSKKAQEVRQKELVLSLQPALEEINKSDFATTPFGVQFLQAIEAKVTN